MKLLLDQNLSFRLCEQLADIFPGSSQARLAGLSQATDRALWDHARANGFMLVSHDSDFAELAALLGPPPKLIWLRCGNRPTSFIERMLRNRASMIDAFDRDAHAACLEIY